MRTARAALVAIVAGLVLGTALPCGAGPGPEPRQYLDRRTAATVTVAARPIVFANARTAYAVNARDYVSLAAVDVNRSGRHMQYWWGYVWTTIGGGDPAGYAATTGWLLIADGRPITLRPVAGLPAELGIGDAPLDRPVRDAHPVLFVADAEVLDYVGAAAELRLQTTDGSSVFELWRDARAELKAFAGSLSH